MRGIVIGGMVLSLLMGCNNGIADELTAEKRLGEIGRSAENVFYSFIDLIAGKLGFTVKAGTTKKEVGQHFTDLGKQFGIASAKLEEVAEKAAADGDKDGILGKAIREAVDAAKNTLSVLKGHLESLKDIGDGTVVGDAEATNKFGAADDDALKKAYNALKEIVKMATNVGITKLTEGSTTLNINGVDNNLGAKILATKTNQPGATDISKSAIILTAVTGEEMLDSIVKSGENDLALSTNANGTTTAMSFARGGQADHLANDSAKAAAVAGGIALRSLVKTGKLAAGANAKSAGGQEEVQGVGVIAANKLLEVVEDIIKKTVKKVLEKAKVEIDKARDSKAIV